MMQTSRTVTNGIMNAVSMQPALAPVGGLRARALLLPCWPDFMMRRWRGAGSSRSAEGFARCSCEPGKCSGRDYEMCTKNQMERALFGLAALVPVQSFEHTLQNLPTAQRA